MIDLTVFLIILSAIISVMLDFKVFQQFWKWMKI